MSRIISLDIGEVEYPDPNVFKTCPKISSTGACPKCVENISVKSKEHLKVKGVKTKLFFFAKVFKKCATPTSKNCIGCHCSNEPH